MLRLSAKLERLITGKRPLTLSDSLLSEFNGRTGFVPFVASASSDLSTSSAASDTRGVALVDAGIQPPIRLIYGPSKVDQAYLK